MDIAAIKQNQRRMWSSGDYPAIARTIEASSVRAVEEAGVSASDDVLDVACGSGNSAIPAAQAGAKVTGLDLTPEMFDIARARAAEAGVEIDWIEGDAEDLPFPDDSFDRVLSVFGAMFAPRHEVAAAEIMRVCRPGGTFAVAAWTPEGLNGQMFKTLGGHMPPPPEGFRPPVLWGTEDHVRALFAGTELRTGREMASIEWESAQGWLDFCVESLGPATMAHAALEPQGKWDAAAADLLALYEEANLNTDGTARWEAEYLLTVGRLPD